jgi:hypothetical protein
MLFTDVSQTYNLASSSLYVEILSIEDAVDDLIHICLQKGGRLS